MTSPTDVIVIERTVIRSDENVLRAYVRSLLVEASWEDPSVVIFKRHDDVVEGDDDEEPDVSDEENAQYKITKSAEKNLTLHKRDNFTHDNRGMASMKPIVPKQAGGPQSGRQPGPGRPPLSRSYSAGF